MTQRVRIGIVLGTTVLYVVGFPPLYSVAGPVASLLVAVPVAATGWLWGLRAGVLAGLLNMPVSWLLFAYVQNPTPNPMIPAVVNGLAWAGVGGVIGWLKEILDRIRTQSQDLSHERAALQKEIAERQRVEEALRESEQRYRLIAENATDVIWTRDMNLHLTYTSPAIERLRGYTVEEVMAQPLDETVTPTSAETVRMFYAQVLTDAATLPLDHVLGQSRTMELEFLCKNGSTVWLESHTRFFAGPDGQIAGLLGVSHDVTERRRAQEALRRAYDELELRVQYRTAELAQANRELRDEIAERKRVEHTLRESEERYRLHFENVSEVIYSLDCEMKITSVSPSVERHLGYRPEELLGKQMHELNILAPESTPAALADIMRVLAGERIDSAIYEFIAKDGTRKMSEVSGTPLFREGQVVGWMSVARDITERKRIEEMLAQERASLAQRVEERTAELSRVNAELVKAARAKDEFLASMSHELRTPLNAILGLSEALQEQVFGALNEKQLKYMHTIEESGRHLLSLINDILDLSKIGAGKMELMIAPVVVEAVCRASVLFVKQAALQKQVEVSCVVDRQVTMLEADERRLKQILVNLLSNAVKFTPAGGRVGIKVSGDPERKTVDFVVWDTGIGIAPEDVKRLFQPFVQLDSRLSRQYSGTGLGLALAYRMAEMHGGSISVQSVAGQGSQFTVSLPWRSATASAGKPAASESKQGSAPAQPARAITVLVAEDNESNIDAFSSYLTARQYQVVIARNGQEALERAKETRPDVILMDVQMPVMDGLEAIQCIRADAELAGIPIIALTALTMPGDEEQCLAAGANAYLGKPVALRELLNAITTQLAQT